MARKGKAINLDSSSSGCSIIDIDFEPSRSGPKKKRTNSESASEISHSSKSKKVDKPLKNKVTATGPASRAKTSSKSETVVQKRTTKHEGSSVSSASTSKSSMSKVQDENKPSTSKDKSGVKGPKMPTETHPIGAKVESIAYRWIGKMRDTGKQVYFYLPKYKGHPLADYDDNEAWLTADQLKHVKQMVEEFDKKKDKEEEAEKAEQRRKRNQKKKTPTFYYVDEDEHKPAIDWDEYAKREAREALAGGDGPKKVRAARPAENSVENYRKRRVSDDSSMKEPEPPRGFGRGLEPECIIGAHVYREHMLYLMKWHGDEEPDFLLEAECRKKCPTMLINYLEDSLLVQIRAEKGKSKAEQTTKDKNKSKSISMLNQKSTNLNGKSKK